MIDKSCHCTRWDPKFINKTDTRTSMQAPLETTIPGLKPGVGSYLRKVDLWGIFPSDKQQKKIRPACSFFLRGKAFPVLLDYCILFLFFKWTPTGWWGEGVSRGKTGPPGGKTGPPANQKPHLNYTGAACFSWSRSPRRVRIPGDLKTSPPI